MTATLSPCPGGGFFVSSIVSPPISQYRQRTLSMKNQGLWRFFLRF
nr:MAG TPA: hypothetical protein [Caudoviricetes sp.]